MKLYDVAHARSGDKGDISNISIIAFEKGDFEHIRDCLTPERVQAQLADRVHGPVERYEMPGLLALNFVLHRALAGGVTRSLALDAHGKCLSSVLLAMDIPSRSEPP